jgi:hypothetical protein
MLQSSSESCPHWFISHRMTQMRPRAAGTQINDTGTRSMCHGREAATRFFVSRCNVSDTMRDDQKFNIEFVVIVERC